MSPTCRATLAAGLLTLLAGATSAAGVAPADDEPAAGDDAPADDLHRRYGFLGPILSKFDDGMLGLCAGDVDGDGHADLAVVNNAKAKIQVLLHRDADEPLAAEPTELVNELPDEVHFRRVAAATEQKVWALAVADLDGDGRADLAFTGDSNKLTVAYSDASLDFTRRIQLAVEDGVADPSSLRAGDVDGDGRADVVVMTKAATLLFLQDREGRLETPIELANATESADGFDLADLDGDGRLDLLYVLSESDWPLRFRLGQIGASFGPETRTRLSQIRAFASSDLERDGSAEVVVLGRSSGRATVLALQAVELERSELSAPRILPFARIKENTRRDVVVVDLDGDGLPDVLAAEPSAARLVTWRGTPDGQFRSAAVWPSLLGSSRPAVAQLDDDELPEIVLAAPEESSVALVQVDAQGALSFPQTLGAPGGELLALATGDTDGDDRAEVWVVVGDGRGRTRTRSLKRLLPEGGAALDLGERPADPTDMLFADLDRDGRDDLLLFIPTEMPVLLRARGEGGALEVAPTDAPGFGLLKGLSRPSLFFGDVDGDGIGELLVPGSNFARALHLDEHGLPVVIGQYNLDAAAAEVSAVAAADLGGDGVRDVILVDKSRHRLTALAPGEAGWRPSAQVDLTGLEPTGLVVADVDRDGTEDLLLVGPEQLATVQAGGSEPRLVPGASYESPVKDAYLDRVAAGDVNGDGQADLVFTETRQSLLHVAAVQPEGLAHALKFRVFEGRLFESARRASREPREVLVADVSGDGLLDIVLLVHDRVLSYFQEPRP